MDISSKVNDMKKYWTQHFGDGYKAVQWTYLSGYVRPDIKLEQIMSELRRNALEQSRNMSTIPKLIFRYGASQALEFIKIAHEFFVREKMEYTT